MHITVLLWFFFFTQTETTFMYPIMQLDSHRLPVVIILIFSEIWENLLRFGFPPKRLWVKDMGLAVVSFPSLSFHPFLSLSFSFFSSFFLPPFSFNSKELEWNIRKNIIEEGKPIKTRIFGLTSSNGPGGLVSWRLYLRVSYGGTHFRIVPLETQKATSFAKGCLKEVNSPALSMTWEGWESSAWQKLWKRAWNCSCYFLMG